MYLTTKSGRKIKLPSDDEDVVITQQAIEEGTYLTDEELNLFKPVSEISEMQTFLKHHKQSTPKITKDRITISLSPKVTSYFKGTGDGWQTKMDEVLLDYVIAHQ